MSRASSAVENVPLISDDRNTATTSSPASMTARNASASDAADGCELVGNPDDDRSAW
ncbi:MAG: hypothetical protein QMD96_05925 [Anaerosomatales bacterium]|nr:hypothetical protein [Anaerosomatales bacterium]